MLVGRLLKLGEAQGYEKDVAQTGSNPLQMLDPVFEACPGLVTLKLLSCRLLRGDALQALLPRQQAGGQALPRLTDLDVSYCNRLQTSVLADLLLQGRQLKVLLWGRWPV